MAMLKKLLNKLLNNLLNKLLNKLLHFKSHLNHDLIVSKHGLNGIVKVTCLCLLSTQFTPNVHACLLHMPHTDMKYTCFVGVYNLTIN